MNTENMKINAISTFALAHNAHNVNNVRKNPEEWICEFCNSSYPDGERCEVEEKAICPNCLTEKTDKCFYCEERYFNDNLDVTQEGYYFCESCRDDYRVEWCDDCGEYCDADNAEWLERYEKIVCNSCLENNYVICECCNEHLYKCDSYGDDYIYLCERCYEDSYYRCEECNRLILIDESCYDENRGCTYCADCYEEIRRNIINEYEYKPSPNFHKMNYETYSNPRYFGVELEVDDGGEDTDNAEKLLNIANYDFEENIYIKHDGSLEKGFEIVSHPMTLDYHMKEMEWESLMKKAVSMGYNSHNTLTCGLHIHVNRASLGETYNDRDSATANIIYLFEKFWDKFAIISRREEYKLEKWAGCYGFDVKMSPIEMLEEAKKTKYRYHAINLRNLHTIEFRLFRGTLKYSTFIAAIQLVDTICEIACKMTEAEIQNLTWGGIIEKIPENYSELINFLGSKNLIEKDKPIFEIEGTILVKYNGDEKTVLLPIGITKIEDDAFNDSNVEEIIIPYNSNLCLALFDGSIKITKQDYNPEDFIIENGELLEYNGKDTKVTIPKIVSIIGAHAFYCCSTIKEVIIPDGVVVIKTSAFAHCSSLTRVVIPNSVTKIGDGAFRECYSLTSITIPNSVVEIEMSAFKGCSSLTSIIIPNSVKNIGSKVFYNCTALKNISISNNITRINTKTFWNCSALTEIIIPDGVIEIENSAFDGCMSLKNITIPDTVAKIGEFAFRNCQSLKEIIIPHGVFCIKDCTFENCISLTSVIIPDSVTCIKKYAFEYCQSLTNIFIPDSVKVIEVGVFNKCFSLENINIPVGIDCISNSCFANCISLKEIVIPNNIDTILANAFLNCISLTEAIISNGVSYIGDFAFAKCSSLTSITIPDSVAKIGDYAFEDCISLKNVSIPNGAFIGDAAFRNCDLTPKLAIGNCVFKSCDLIPQFANAI